MPIELITCEACGTKNAASRTACLRCGADLASGTDGEKQKNQPSSESFWERTRRSAKNLFEHGEDGRTDFKKVMAREWLIIVLGFFSCQIFIWLFVVFSWVVAPRETEKPYTLFGYAIFGRVTVYEVTTDSGIFTIGVNAYWPPKDQKQWLENELEDFREFGYTITEVRVRSIPKKLSLRHFLRRLAMPATVRGSGVFLLLYALYLLARSAIWCVRTLRHSPLSG